MAAGAFLSYLSHQSEEAHLDASFVAKQHQHIRDNAEEYGAEVEHRELLAEEGPASRSQLDGHLDGEGHTHGLYHEKRFK